jgi:hypothetical protein
MSLKEQILAARKKPQSETLHGLTVYLRRMTLGEAEAYYDAVKADKGKTYFLMRLLLSFCLCEENGTHCFSNADELKGLDSEGEKLALKAMELNGFTDATRAAIEKKVPAGTDGSNASLSAK